MPSAPDAVLPSAHEAVMPFGEKARIPSAPLTVIPEVFQNSIPSAPEAVMPLAPLIVSPARAGTALNSTTRLSARAFRIFLELIFRIKHKPSPRSGQDSGLFSNRRGALVKTRTETTANSMLRGSSNLLRSPCISILVSPRLSPCRFNNYKVVEQAASRFHFNVTGWRPVGLS